MSEREGIYVGGKEISERYVGSKLVYPQWRYLDLSGFRVLGFKTDSLFSRTTLGNIVSFHRTDKVGTTVEQLTGVPLKEDVKYDVFIDNIGEGIQSRNEYNSPIVYRSFSYGNSDTVFLGIELDFGVDSRGEYENYSKGKRFAEILAGLETKNIKLRVKKHIGGN